MSSGDISALLLTLREGTEMALVVGIVLAYLGQVAARGAQRWVWLGVAAAVAVSLVFLGVLNALDRGLVPAGRDVVVHGSGSYTTADYRRLDDAAIVPFTTTDDIAAVLLEGG